MVNSSVGCPRFFVSQAVSSGLVPILVLYRRAAAGPFVHGCEAESYLTELVTCEAHPYSQQVKERRRFRYRLPV
ncbi:hypothetical protein Taro_029810 [Colocasia esculenta]|uniref:Uncharacterized protein n=1 Tax=Colocasia esculenta TaxID=4460 RepID=A0A843W1E6_COLES|nr:hypothetical protein [Colocasia esculenta]